MSMPDPPVYYTPKMVSDLIREDRAWPRYETVHGQLLVTPGPPLWHQEVAGRILLRLADYVDDEPGCGGFVLMSPSEISLRPDSLVQPDVFIFRRPASHNFEWTDITGLLLVVEILSPPSATADRFTKRRLYQEWDVPAYWAIDPDQNLAEIWTPDAIAPVVERVKLQWHPAGAAQPFVMTLEELLRAI